MKAIDILDMESVNSVDEVKVSEIWVGAPILTYGNVLITGSHRQAALRMMFDNGDDIDFECAYDVSDIINDKINNGMDMEDIWNNLDYLRAIFAGTWVEEYKDEIEEW